MSLRTLRENFQVVSTNRYVVDSPRFWRPEFHPRFKDIFTIDDFKEIIIKVNNTLSFPITDEFIEDITLYLFNWFSGQRFVGIPDKNPLLPKQFLSELYFVLLDTLSQFSLQSYQLGDDDFNVVTNKADTGKKDNTQLTTDELLETNTNIDTYLNSDTNSTFANQNTNAVENIDEDNENNGKQVSDVFLSPQNQGVTPTTVSEKGKGVEGVTIPSSPTYTTNTANNISGDSSVNKSNTTTSGSQSDESFGMTDNSGTTTSNSNNNKSTNGVNITNEKTDNYQETLEFNRGARLQDWYNLNNDRLWAEILSRLCKYILQFDIATSERNYLNCKKYE